MSTIPCHQLSDKMFWLSCYNHLYWKYFISTEISCYLKRFVLSEYICESKPKLVFTCSLLFSVEPCHFADVSGKGIRDHSCLSGISWTATHAPLVVILPTWSCLRANGHSEKHSQLVLTQPSLQELLGSPVVIALVTPEALVRFPTWKQSVNPIWCDPCRYCHSLTRHSFVILTRSPFVIQYGEKNLTVTWLYLKTYRGYILCLNYL